MLIFIRRTTTTLLDRCIELQPGLASNKEEIDYLTQSIQIQLTEIYKNYEHQEKNNKSKNGEEAGKKIRYPVYKYSTKGKGSLHEAVILADLPVFLKYENGVS